MWKNSTDLFAMLIRLKNTSICILPIEVHGAPIVWVQKSPKTGWFVDFWMLLFLGLECLHFLPVTVANKGLLLVGGGFKYFF